MSFTYLALVFPVVGTVALLFAQRSLLGDESSLFKHVLEQCSYEVQERVEAVLRRRRAVERFDPRFLWVAIVLLWLGGGLGLVRAVSVSMSFAICAFAFSAVVAAQIAFVSRLRTGKAVATLERRSLTWQNLLLLAVVIAAWGAAGFLCVRFGSGRIARRGDRRDDIRRANDP